MKKTILTTTAFALLATGIIFSCKKKDTTTPDPASTTTGSTTSGTTTGGTTGGGIPAAGTGSIILTYTSSPFVMTVSTNTVYTSSTNVMGISTTNTNGTGYSTFNASFLGAVPINTVLSTVSPTTTLLLNQTGQLRCLVNTSVFNVTTDSYIAATGQTFTLSIVSGKQRVQCANLQFIGYTVPSNTIAITADFIAP